MRKFKVKGKSFARPLYLTPSEALGVMRFAVLVLKYLCNKKKRIEFKSGGTHHPSGTSIVGRTRGEYIIHPDVSKTKAPN